MFDTPITIVGNALTAPEWRTLSTTGTLVANFRIASTARRYDRENDRWTDGETLRVRVNCWRRLAENVAASIAVGEPIIVTGKLFTRDWTDDDNNRRRSYELEAYSVGHDLARGRTRIYRNRALAVTGTADTPEAEGVIRGEQAELVDGPLVYGEGIPDDHEPPALPDRTVVAAKPDPLTTLAGGGFEPFDKEVADSVSEELEGLEIEVEAIQEPARRTRRTKREPVPA